jgi:pimeloyl-ACP methyl ester carboxylesterase
MKMRIVVALLAACVVVQAPAVRGAATQTSSAGIAGSWQGTLATGAVNLRLAFKVSQAPDGALTATLDSLDQGVTGMPAEVSLAGNVVRFALKSAGISFEGRLSTDGSRIEGTFTQGGGSFPLVLTRGEAAVPKRPQEARDVTTPPPYLEEQVRYQNRAGGITFAGTLTLPRSAVRSPAVILISGSGPEDRDETVFGHKPFLVLADHLTRNGIAVLRVDDRGVGGSSGTTDTATSDDFAGDVLAGIAYLKGRREIDTAHIGLIGHSEGGLIAPIVATRSKDVAFIVMLAGPGLPGEQILYLQAAAVNRANGATDAQVAANQRLQERIFAIMKTEKDLAAADAKFAALRDEFVAAAPAAQKPAIAAQLNAQFKSVSTPWFRYFLTYDPRPALSKLTCPVLALIGERDLQVPYAENLPAIEAALKAGGNRDVTAIHLPQLNHLFQTATTGSPNEYAQIEETMAPVALKTVSDWIAKRIR